MMDLTLVEAAGIPRELNQLCKKVLNIESVNVKRFFVIFHIHCY